MIVLIGVKYTWQKNIHDFSPPHFLKINLVAYNRNSYFQFYTNEHIYLTDEKALLVQNHRFNYN
mgnify:CR=1 FL=1